jgi:hypothetical protein
MGALTVYQAEAEARWRWGGLFARGFARYSSTQSMPFEVGTKLFGSVEIKGRGKSWESAFGNADGLTKTRKRPRK